MATVAAVIASTHHPFYYRASTSTGADRPPFADEWVAKIEAFRETLTRARARRPGDGRQRPLPPAVAGQHAAVPGRQGAVLRRQLLQRGARVRPAADDAPRAGGPLRAHPAQRAGRRLRPGVQQRAADRPQHHLPDHHAAAAGRPADRADLHQHLRAAAAAAEAVRRSSAARSGEMVESWPEDKRVAIIGTGHLSLELGGPRQFGEHGPDPEFDRKAVEWIASGDLEGCLRRGDAGQPAPSRATPPTASWTSC